MRTSRRNQISSFLTALNALMETFFPKSMFPAPRDHHHFISGSQPKCPLNSERQALLASFTLPRSSCLSCISICMILPTGKYHSGINPASRFLSISNNVQTHQDCPYSRRCGEILHHRQPPPAHTLLETILHQFAYDGSSHLI